MQQHTSIKLLNDKEPITDRVFLVKDKVKGTGKNGRAFLSLLIGDKSGHIDARVWDRVDEISDLFDIGDLISVKGLVQVYQGRKQIIVHKLEKADQNQFKKEDFLLEDVKIDVHALFAEMMSIVSTVQSPPIRQILTDSLQDDEIKELLLKAPAAKSIHHAKRGGLLEHIVSICKMMKLVASHYNYLNEDLLIFGAIFHDIGKVWELEINREQIQYSHKGRLLGHMQLACELIDRKSQRILGFPEDLREILKHIVLSHHGKLEYGSPVRPYIMEAFVVASIDELDSKMDTMFGFIKDERETGDSWSRYSEHFERYFYLQDLKGRWT
ncbi:3'-5' exoribonuclease YhaM family protein [Pseudobdellovibrio exovorus]|uniref:HD-hydrolase domain-containing protein n=1 Tax=Pseudobdellovibrio exovorus JSS TaxID=1184267 RepID=M4VCH6_9BACT|nr:HD domain-containing protein [Pseudobdellovibrio exovorus]AGH96185.1 HD-hydrolase domain-containing protein [Pseudobdellovibrio exovorus JSS]